MGEKRKDSKKRVLKDGEYERPNGTYEYRWRNKKGQRKAIYAKSLDELREKERDILKDVLNGKVILDKNMTINNLYVRWEKLKRGLRESTFQNYIYFYKQYVESNFGETRLHLLKKSDVRAFYVYLHEDRGIQISSIHNVHKVLHQVLEIGVEDGYFYSNPADNALKELRQAYNAEVKKRKALTVSQQKIFENWLSRKGMERWQTIFTVMLYTGMRIGEVTGLQWEDIDFEEDYIKINKTLVYYPHAREGIFRECEFTMNSTKTPSSCREIPMIPIVKEMFLKEKEHQKSCGISCEYEVDGYNDFVFLNRFNCLQHQNTLNKALKRIIRDCNYAQIDKGEETLPPFTCHNLRHTFATRLCEANVNLKAIQDILGHSDVSTTLDIYTDATKELKRKEAIALEEYFNKTIHNTSEE